MATADRISDLARGAGAQLAHDLPPNEIVSFIVGKDGRLRVTLADGEQLTVALRSDIPADQSVGAGLTTADVLSKVLPELYRYGAHVPRNVPFFRRSRVMCGRRTVEFREAGR